MNLKTKKIYIEKIEDFFKDREKTKILFLEQIKKFEKAEQEFKLNEHKYKLGEKVYLKKGTFMHGIREVKASNLDSIIKEGIISFDFQGEYNPDQKTPWCISVWNIQKDILLKDYIYIQWCNN